jgi:hypothetical protein
VDEEAGDLRDGQDEGEVEDSSSGVTACSPPPLCPLSTSREASLTRPAVRRSTASPPSGLRSRRRGCFRSGVLLSSGAACALHPEARGHLVELTQVPVESSRTRRRGFGRDIRVRVCTSCAFLLGDESDSDPMGVGSDDAALEAGPVGVVLGVVGGIDR